MLGFTGGLKVFLAVEPCDMRKSFNGLHGLVVEKLGEDPRTGALFVFCNRRRTRLKVLYFDGTGLWVLTKRLEQGTFSWPQTAESQSAKLKLTPEAVLAGQRGPDFAGQRALIGFETTTRASKPA